MEITAVNEVPSVDRWLCEAKLLPEAGKIGMYLCHNGVVRGTSRAQVREGIEDRPVTRMRMRCDRDKADRALAEAETMPGIYHVRLWINEGTLSVGDDLMKILIGADTRPHAVACLNALLDKVKKECVTEEEVF